MTQNIAKTKRTSQAIDNFSFDEEYLMAGVIPMVENPEGTAIERQKYISTDPLAPYQLANYEIIDGIIYLGKTDKDAKWFIKKIDTAIGLATYCRGDTDYDTNWLNKEDLTYDSFNNLF